MRITRKELINNEIALRKENAELRKVCQCRECRHGTLYGDNEDGAVICGNKLSNNLNDCMHPYASCKQCERR